MKTTIENIIKKALKDIGVTEEVSFVVEHPADMKMGDYSTNVAMVCAKKIGQNPKEFAEKLVLEMQKNPLLTLPFGKGEDEGRGLISEIQVAGPGFINFYLSREFFTKSVEEILNKGKDWGKSEIYKNKRILVEHSSPNLFKPFHVGHVMNETIGESISRLAKFSGADVDVISFPSDISLGISKAVFIILEKHNKNGQIFRPSDVVLLGNAYVEGTKRYDEDENVHERINEIANNLYLRKESLELEVYDVCKKFNMEYFEYVTKMLGSEFDGYIFESEAGIVGEKLVKENTPSIFTKSEGAVVYIPEVSKKHINTTVFINSQGNPTYGAKDLGLLKIKFEKYSPDLSIFITDHQQMSHFDVVLDAAEKINKNWAEKSIHRTHGRMSFKGQKMSSRLGGVPLAKDLIEEVTNQVKEKSKDLNEHDCLAISVASLKFSILRAMAGKNIDFDPEKSLSFEGDSGPYLQYSIVRAKSIIEKLDNLNYQQTQIVASGNRNVTEFEKKICRFQYVVEEAIKEWSPHYVVTYLLELARVFNGWYGNTKVIDLENHDMVYNVALTKAFIETMENGLWLLGVEIPEEM